MSAKTIARSPRSFHNVHIPLPITPINTSHLPSGCQYPLKARPIQGRVVSAQPPSLTLTYIHGNTKRSNSLLKVDNPSCRGAVSAVRFCWLFSPLMVTIAGEKRISIECGQSETLPDINAFIPRSVSLNIKFSGGLVFLAVQD